MTVTEKLFSNTASGASWPSCLKSTAAGYFVVVDAAPLGYADGGVLCRELPERAGVVGVPVSAFVHPDRQDAYRSLVRFAFCKRRTVLEEASARLAGLSAR